MSSPENTKRKKCKNLLRQIFSEKNTSGVDNILKEMESGGKSFAEWHKILKTITVFSNAGEGQKNTVQDLYAAGFSLPHIALLGSAPVMKDRLEKQKTQGELLDLWNRTEKFKPRIKKSEIAERGIIASSTLFAIISLGLYAGMTVTTYVTKDPAYAQSVQIMADYVGSWAGTVVRAIVDQQPKDVLGALAPMIPAVYAVIKNIKHGQEALKSLSLDDKIRDLPLSRERKDEYITMLDGLTKHSLHIIKHLEPEELAIFLDSSDEDRLRILKVRPPSLEQRQVYNACELLAQKDLSFPWLIKKSFVKNHYELLSAWSNKKFTPRDRDVVGGMNKKRGLADL